MCLKYIIHCTSIIARFFDCNFTVVFIHIYICVYINVIVKLLQKYTFVKYGNIHWI